MRDIGIISIVLKSDGSIQDPTLTDLGLEPSSVEEKIKREKTGVTWLTRQDMVKNSVTTH